MKTTHIQFDIQRYRYTIQAYLSSSYDSILVVEHKGVVSTDRTSYTFSKLDIDMLKIRHPYVDNADWETLEESFNQLT